MKVVETKLPGVIIFEPDVYADARGYFQEIFQKERYQAHGIDLTFVQDNISRSKQHVLRGLHFQVEQPQGKLVFVSRGRVFDVAVDVRYGSPTFGEFIAVILDDENHRQVYIPPGFAHGFCVLSDEADFIYKCTDYYHHSSERGILWNDADIAIPWPVTNPILSTKDSQNALLKDISPDFIPRYGS